MTEGTSTVVTTVETTTERALNLDDVFTGTRLVAVVGGITACAFVLIIIFAIGIVYCKYRTRSETLTDDGESGMAGEFVVMNTLKLRKMNASATTASDKSEQLNSTEVTIHRDLSKERAQIPDGERDVDGNLRITELDPIYQETDPALSRKLNPLTEDKSSRPYKPLRKSGSVSAKGVVNLAFEQGEDDDAGYDSVDNIQVLSDDNLDNEHIYSHAGTDDNNESEKEFDEHKF